MKHLSTLLILCACSITLMAQKSESGTMYVKHYRSSDAEQKAKDYIDDEPYLLPIEGIWQSSDGYKYFISSDQENDVKTAYRYRMIVLESSYEGWNRGDIKAFIDFGSIEGTYSMKYYTANQYGKDVSSQQILLIQESPLLMSFSLLGTDKEIALYRLYPMADDNEQNTFSNSTGNDKQWSGSGISISPKYIATNYHVVEGAKTLVVSGVNGKANTNYEVEVVASDKYNDLAILKIVDSTFTEFPTIKYGFSTATKDLGTDIFVLGYPLISTMGEDIKLTNGIISAKTGFQGDVSLYQISAPVQPGNSGGPLFDDNGDLIGIVNAKHNGAENVGYAIKLNYLKTLIESADLHISLTSNNTIKDLPLKDKVKVISPFVVMIKANVTDSKINNTISEQISIKQLAKAKDLYYKAKEAKDDLFSYQYLQQCNTILPTPQTMLHLGIKACNLDKYEEAIKAFEYCINNDYRVKEVHLYLGYTYSDMGNQTESIKYLTKCIELSQYTPDIAIDAYFARGLRHKEAELPKAIEDYKQVTRLEGVVGDDFHNRYTIATAYNNIAYSYMCMDTLDNRVNENITEALKRMHNQSFMWDTYGEYAYKVGDYERCIYGMNNAITIAKAEGDNDRSNSYLYRGLAYLQLGDTLHAYNDLKQSAELNDSTAQAELKKLDNFTFNNAPTPYSKVINKPSYKMSLSANLTLLSVEITEECTILTFRSLKTNRWKWYMINEETYIRDCKTGNDYPLLATENCKFSLQGHTYYKNGKAEFKLYFTKLPLKTKKIDFIEPKGSDWKIYGIQLK